MHCKATTKKGKACKANATKGGSFCHTHTFDPDAASRCVSLMSKHMLSLVALKTRMCRRGAKSIPTEAKAEMKRLETSLCKTVVKARTSNHHAQLQRKFSQDSQELHRLISKYCVRRQQGRRSYMDDSPDIPPPDPETEAPVPVAVAIPVATVVDSPSTTMAKVEEIVKHGDRRSVKTMLRKTVDTMWAVVKRVNTYAKTITKASINFVKEFWGIILFIVLLAAYHKKSWIIDAIPKDLKRILELTLKYMAEVGGILLGPQIMRGASQGAGRALGISFYDDDTMQWLRKRSWGWNPATDAAKNLGADAAKELGSSVERGTQNIKEGLTTFGGQLQMIVMIICATYLVSTVLRIFLDKKTHQELPKPPEITIDKDAKKPSWTSKFKGKAPKILMAIFGVAALAIAVNSGAGQAFIHNLAAVIRSNEVVRDATVQSVDLMNVAANTMSKDDEDEAFQDALNEYAFGVEF